MFSPKVKKDLLCVPAEKDEHHQGIEFSLVVFFRADFERPRALSSVFGFLFLSENPVFIQGKGAVGGGLDDGLVGAQIYRQRREGGGHFQSHFDASVYGDRQNLSLREGQGALCTSSSGVKTSLLGGGLQSENLSFLGHWLWPEACIARVECGW